MDTNNKRNMWQFPWLYKESIAFLLGILLVSTLLQLTLGSFDFYLLHFPVNLIIGACLIVLIAVLSFVKDNPIVNWLSSVPLSVTLIGGLFILTIFMGLIPQFARVNTDLHIHMDHASFYEIVDYAITKLGLKQVTTSWPFVFVYIFNLLVLGLVIAKRLHRFKWRDYGFYLNHFGLWLFLFAAGFGSADMLRYVMYVEEGNVEWRVYDNHENVLELDIAIQLHDFVMEEYEPKLAVVNKFSGDVQPENKPAYYQIDEKNRKEILAGWELELQEYIHEAVRQTDTSFQAIPMAGSMPAARVKVTNIETKQTVSGWLTCGSVDQFVMPLDLDSTYSLVMTKPEAKRFASDVTVMTKDGKDPIRTTLEVNSPLRMGDWMIYQYDYDHALGKASRMSGFELVYDPWLYAVYVGIFMIAMGSICMLWLGNRNRKKE
ncbi:cytochrome c biogenesis protein ResB [Dysgonomonas sp. Marseille-P4361]|uniref:cytochrome c biogenesis protein ResB n=1 Tax=Dysgonomonas sp. Marseille-P4361 TaxID=2161820 RepID=UPI0021009F62|nr:cytochrome c biogenesis protein ResB [Dysgonomonas sp. Marseille-P4361]